VEFKIAVEEHWQSAESEGTGAMTSPDPDHFADVHGSAAAGRPEGDAPG
jgi:hypothetical protein